MSWFNLKENTLGTLPCNEDNKLITESNELINSITKDWNKNKIFKFNNNNLKIQTYSKKINSEYVVARVNVFPNDENHKYENFIHYLIGAERNPNQSSEWGVSDNYNHTRFEQNYIKVLESWEPLEFSKYKEYSKLVDQDGNYSEQYKHLKDWIGVKLVYNIGPIFNKREFNEFIFIQPPILESSFNKKIHPENNSEVSFVISLVAKPLQDNNNFVNGLYCSIERIKLNLQTNEIEWAMMTSSDAKGSLPLFLQKLGIDKSISEDVPSFLNFITQ
ncbi:hypothetical protein PACTADRAFT_52009 [Pachysolen tannophilus NRRL Y-2460]|uniref:DUF3074 domain-containing protein n=1 Tax=Pachysolen tannophilus NRRL Y-2460 TaxID=669874 RepID=A0A1E4TP14_PACTA|nr:hypothetical protein PACTADRAFT_52009 [Pachysolen tannophilus NRRL Y-2460]